MVWRLRLASLIRGSYEHGPVLQDDGVGERLRLPRRPVARRLEDWTTESIRPSATADRRRGRRGRRADAEGDAGRTSDGLLQSPTVPGRGDVRKRRPVQRPGWPHRLGPRRPEMRFTSDDRGPEDPLRRAGLGDRPSCSCPTSTRPGMGKAASSWASRMDPGAEGSRTSWSGVDDVTGSTWSAVVRHSGRDPAFAPGGTNVNFVGPVGDRTRSGGSGPSSAGSRPRPWRAGPGPSRAAVVLEASGTARPPVRIWTRSGFLPLDIDFNQDCHDKLSRITLTGEGRLVFRGIIGESQTTKQ